MSHTPQVYDGYYEGGYRGYDSYRGYNGYYARRGGSYDHGRDYGDRHNDRGRGGYDHSGRNGYRR